MLGHLDLGLLAAAGGVGAGDHRFGSPVAVDGDGGGDRYWGAETMVASLDTRRRRKEAKIEVPKHAIPVPSPEAIRYCEARNALSAITSPAEGQAVFETYQDVWDDALGEFAANIASLL